METLRPVRLVPALRADSPVRRRVVRANAPSRSQVPRPPIPVRHRSLEDIASALDRRVAAWAMHFDEARAALEALDAQLRQLSPTDGSVGTRQIRAVRELLKVVDERLYVANSQVQLSRSQTAIIARLSADLVDGRARGARRACTADDVGAHDARAALRERDEARARADALRTELDLSLIHI